MKQGFGLCVLAVAICALTLASAAELLYTTTAVPGVINPRMVYQSSNSPVVFVPNDRDINGQYLRYYSYDPTSQALLSQAGIHGISQGKNHVDQLYYDATNNYVIAQMRVGMQRGFGAFYPHAFKADDTSVWENSSFSIYPNVASNVGVVDGTVVMLNMTEMGKDYLRIVAADAKTGAVRYTMEYWNEFQCNGHSGVCVAVGYRADYIATRGFDPATGKTLFEIRCNHTSFGPYTLGDMYEEFMIMTNGNGYTYVIDTLAGTQTQIGAESFHLRGPNLVWELHGNTERHFFAYSLRKAKTILNVSFAFSGNGDGSSSWYNNEVIVHGIPSSGGDHLKLHFYKADDGSFINTVAISTPTRYLSCGPFLVQSKLIVPLSLSSYDVVTPNTGSVTSGSAGAKNFGPDFLYLANGNTLMWTANSLVQFNGTTSD